MLSQIGSLTVAFAPVSLWARNLFGVGWQAALDVATVLEFMNAVLTPAIMSSRFRAAVKPMAFYPRCPARRRLSIIRPTRSVLSSSDTPLIEKFNRFEIILTSPLITDFVELVSVSFFRFGERQVQSLFIPQYTEHFASISFVMFSKTKLL